MKCLIIDFDNSIIVIEDLLFLLHIVDISQEESIENYKKINAELEKFDSELAKREQILVLNKIDSVSKKTCP